jgi:YidC/Oxa1 family membrane protein insertase
MNQRFLLALVLTAIVIVITPLVFRPQPAARPSVDTLASKPTGSLPSPAAQAPAKPMVAAALPVRASSLAAGDTTAIHTTRASYTFASAGAAPVAVTLDSYPSRRKGHEQKSAQLIAPGDRLVHYTVALGRDTIRLDTIPFNKIAQGSDRIEYEATAAGFPIHLTYSLPAKEDGDYLIKTAVSVAGAPAGSLLFVQMAEQLYSNEPDTLDDLGHLAISFRPTRGEVQSVGYSKLDTNEVRSEQGPINWVAIRNKYFLLAIRGISGPFNTLGIQGLARPGKSGVHAATTVSLPLKSGAASFEIYTGPQDFERLQRLGGDFDQVNPYAGWFHGVVQPVAAVVMKVLLWMKRSTQLNYGWVLVLFGVAIRLLLWPLNQSAMRTSIQMQRLQPQLQALQKKYSDDPRKQQEAVMKVYKDHGMSPLSPLMGCLPMLLPMPVLFALYFVFNNTIEFRGVSFLWLPDISLRDPYYITPVLMGATMFLMSWIGMRSAPPNPQAKMMSYMMPVMMTALFLNFASGLNLYYAVQNIAAIPQQWLLARERAKNPLPASPVLTPARKRQG